MENIYYEKIHDYLNEQLSPKDRKVFEQELLQNEELAAEMDFYQDLMIGIDVLGDQELNTAIQQAHHSARNKGLLLTEQDMLDYANDDLTAEKTTLVERRMEVDEDFLDQIAFHQTLLGGVDRVGDEDLQSSIQSVHQQMKEEGIIETKKDSKVVAFRPKTTRKRFINTRNLALAASFLLLLSVGLYFLLPSGNSSERLYASNFEINETQLNNELDQLSIAAFAKSENDRKSSLTAALEAFENKEYTEAESLLKTHLENYTEDAVAHFYYGLNLMQNKNFELAIEQFQSVLDTSETSYQTDALWYQALSYLKMNRTQNAILSLRALSSDATYGEQAKEILQALE